MFTLFIYTGKGTNNFRASVPDNIIIFVDSDSATARKVFVHIIGKEPDQMGFEYIEGESKESTWAEAINSNLIDLDIGLEPILELDSTLVINSKSVLEKVNG